MALLHGAQATALFLPAPIFTKMFHKPLMQCEKLSRQRVLLQLAPDLRMVNRKCVKQLDRESHGPTQVHQGQYCRGGNRGR